MANPLQMLFGRNSLGKRIESQSAALLTDIEHWQAQSHRLRESAASTVTSPLALASTVAVGFLAGRSLQRPRRKADDNATPSAPRTLWWEMLLPVGIACARYFVTSHLLADREKTQ